MTSRITINDETIDLEERDRAIEVVWPYDGPHDKDSVVTAADAAAALVRYLNNATQPGQAQHTLPHASAFSDILNGIRSAVMGMNQLLGQLSELIDEHAITGDVYDADHPDDDEAGTARVHELSMQLLEARRSVVQWDGYRLVGGLAADLDKAAALASKIGNRESS